MGCDESLLFIRNRHCGSAVDQDGKSAVSIGFRGSIFRTINKGYGHIGQRQTGKVLDKSRYNGDSFGVISCKGCIFGNKICILGSERTCRWLCYTTFYRD